MTQLERKVLKHGTNWLNGGKQVECPECGGSAHQFVQLPSEAKESIVFQFTCRACGCIFTVGKIDLEKVG